MIKFAKKLWSNRGGYGVVELMIIIAILGAVGVGVGAVFQNKFPNSAAGVGDKVDGYINNW